MQSSANSRDPGPRIAIAASLAWGLLVVSGFWNLVVAPMQVAAATASDPVRIAQVQAWWQAQAVPEQGPLLVVAPSACRCGVPASDAAHAAQAAGVRALMLGPGDALPPYGADVVAVDGDGRVRYAGPLMPRLFCSGRQSLALALLQSAPTDAVALILPAECHCSPV